MTEQPEFAMRTFVDERGTEWEVREIHVPTLAVVPRRYLPHPEYAEGWLLFTTDGERRRLAPFPRDWTSLPTTDLVQCCASAVPVRAPARTLFGGLARPDERQEERQL